MEESLMNTHDGEIKSYVHSQQCKSSLESEVHEMVGNVPELPETVEELTSTIEYQNQELETDFKKHFDEIVENKSHADLSAVSVQNDSQESEVRLEKLESSLNCESESKKEEFRLEVLSGTETCILAVNSVPDGISEGQAEYSFQSRAASKESTPSPSSSTAVTYYDENSTGSGDVSLASEDVDILSLPKDVIEEQRRLALEFELEMNKKNSPLQLDKREKERRYKTLMSLLGKSKEYASYMSKKLIREKEIVSKENTNPETTPKTTETLMRVKRKNTRKIGGSVAKKRKTNVNDIPGTHYKNKMGLLVSLRQPQCLVGARMRDYQLDGLDWMVALYKNGVNGILADEMGLGKTIQVISLLCHLREKRIYGPHLIIAPLSTLPNWIFEFVNFAPDIPVVLYHGNVEKRNLIRDDFVMKMLYKDRSRVPVILTSYEMPLYDKKFLSAVKWCYTIVDEGHRLKNHRSLLSQELRKYRTESRLLLTGTPLQNNLTELWSLLNYLVPEIFNDLIEFENTFDFSDLTDSEKQNKLIQKEKEEQIVSKMHQILEPFLLRRIKTDVNIAIPRKKEILVYSPLTAEQEYLYKSVLDRSIMDDINPDKEKEGAQRNKKSKRKCVTNISYSENWDIKEDGKYDYLNQLFSTSSRKAKKRITDGQVDWVYHMTMLNPAMMLRKIVNHPYLVKTPVAIGTRDIIINDELIQKCGKLLVLDALLPRFKADGHKVLLFSTFRSMLDLIEDYVILRNYKFVRLDGRSRIENRLESIKQFNSDPETFIFLISTRAGGLGINLTAADTVIIYNSDWNPQADLQAQDRCHRIGQTKPVVVYRLVTSGTIDERIVNTGTSKRRLEKLVVRRGKFKQNKTAEEEISLNELKELLQSTDYKQIIHPNGLVLSDEEIENLLDRSDLLNKEETA